MRKKYYRIGFIVLFIALFIGTAVVSFTQKKSKVKEVAGGSITGNAIKESIVIIETQSPDTILINAMPKSDSAKDSNSIKE